MPYDLEKIIDSAPSSVRSEFINRSFSENEVIIQAHSKNKYLHLLISGIVDVYKCSSRGVDLMVNTFEAYDFFGEIELFCPDLPTYKVVSQSASMVILLPRTAVYNWLALDHRIAIYLLSTISRRLYLTSDSFSQTTLLPIKNRVLGGLWEQHIRGTLDSYTKEMLVKDVRAPLRSVNRVIQDAINDGLITYENKTFVLTDEIIMESYAYSYYF